MLTAANGRQLYLFVEDAILLVDISDVSCILVRTLSGELASLVDTFEVVNPQTPRKSANNILLINLSNNTVDGLVRRLVISI